MTSIGDFDPEDQWDDGDPTDVKLDILERVVQLLRLQEGRRLDALRLVAKLELEGEHSPRLAAIREALHG